MNFDLTSIGEKNEYVPSEIVGELHLKEDLREVQHDGYCSDPGEDEGKWMTDHVEKHELNEHVYKTLLKHADPNGYLNIEILKKLFPEKMGCGLGSGYCGYSSERIVKEGRILYVLDERRQKQLKFAAYFISQKDNFRQSPEHYWGLAVARTERRKILQKALAEKGLFLRSDSKLCEKWIDDELLPGDKYYELKDVVRCMIECKWCLEYCNMRKKMDGYKFWFEPDPSDNIFTLVKEKILEEKPVPDILPWPHPIFI